MFAFFLQFNLYFIAKYLKKLIHSFAFKHFIRLTSLIIIHFMKQIIHFNQILVLCFH